MNTLRIKWTGIRPLVMHNGLMVDPTNAYTKRIKEIVAKGAKKLTEADYEERNKLEWMAGLYWAADGPVIPSDNIERAIQLGGQKARIGKDIQACVFCTDPEIPIDYQGPKDKAAMYADPRFVLRKGVGIQKSRIIRIRPMIPNPWTLTFEVEFDDTIVNPASLLKAMTDAGALVGLGDWRPKFGRFLVEQIS